jgi:hypothetical protein
MQQRFRWLAALWFGFWVGPASALDFQHPVYFEYAEQYGFKYAFVHAIDFVHAVLDALDFEYAEFYALDFEYPVFDPLGFDYPFDFEHTILDSILNAVKHGGFAGSSTDYIS